MALYQEIALLVPIARNADSKKRIGMKKDRAAKPFE
jgi:hypothetical protein